jgi:predicted O-methyltransferase YrrM
MMQKIFSVPLNPKLSEQEFYRFVEFVTKYKDYIYDIYFTCRIAPFRQDAMGDIIPIAEDRISLIETAIALQKNTGIKMSATFNNIQVPPTQENLDLFLKNFQPLYDAGIRAVTLPHTHWVATGQIQARYPELHIKNTILRDVRTASEVVNLVKAGFHYINLDRDLMRDRDTLIRLKETKDWIKKNLGKDVEYSLLANEGCLGNCPMMVEHFEYNNTRESEMPQYFNSAISRVSCPKWDAEDPAIDLKTANLPPWREDWQEFLDLGINTFKMHGRESADRLWETFDIIERWANNNPIMFEWFDEYSQINNLVDKPLAVWRDKIKNCKFDCWECQYCDKIYDKRSEIETSPTIQHTVTALLNSGIETTDIDIQGLTSPRVQTLIKNLCSGKTKYLEIGSFLGSTAAAALESNIPEVYCVDKWEEQIQPARQDITVPENNKQSFIDNVKKYKKDSKVFVFDCDMFSVDVSKLKDIDVFFYDGPHDAESTAASVKYFAPCFSEEAILVFDDANWMGVVQGAEQGIMQAGKTILYTKKILNSEENPNQWWNGVFVVVVK